MALKVMKSSKLAEKEGKTLAGSIVRNDEVVGSIPTSSTITFNHLPASESPNCRALSRHWAGCEVCLKTEFDSRSGLRAKSFPFGLFNFAGGRTHRGGLPGLGDYADQRHSAHPAAADGNHVTASLQVGLHWSRESVGDRETSQLRTVLTEGADEMLGREARRPKRLLGAHAEFHVVEDDLDGCLILLVASCYRDRHHGLVVTEKQSGAQSDSRPLAGLDKVRSSLERVQAAEAASVNNAGASGHARCARQAAGSRRDHIPKLICHTHDGGSAMPGPGDRGRLGRFHSVRVARPELKRCFFRIDQL